MTEVAIAAQFNRAITQKEGRTGISNTEAIRIIPQTWNETNVFLIHRTIKKQALRPCADQIYLVIPLANQTCFLHLVDQSEPSPFVRDSVACVNARNLPAPDNHLEITTRHIRRGRMWKKKTII